MTIIAHIFRLLALAAAFLVSPASAADSCADMDAAMIRKAAAKVLRNADGLVVRLIDGRTLNYRNRALETRGANYSLADIDPAGSAVILRAGKCGSDAFDSLLVDLQTGTEFMIAPGSFAPGGGAFLGQPLELDSIILLSRSPSGAWGVIRNMPLLGECSGAWQDADSLRVICNRLDAASTRLREFTISRQKDGGWKEADIYRSPTLDIDALTGSARPQTTTERRLLAANPKSGRRDSSILQLTLENGGVTSFEDDPNWGVLYDLADIDPENSLYIVRASRPSEGNERWWHVVDRTTGASWQADNLPVESPSGNRWAFVHLDNERGYELMVFERKTGLLARQHLPRPNRETGLNCGAGAAWVSELALSITCVPRLPKARAFETILRQQADGSWAVESRPARSPAPPKKPAAARPR